MGQIDHAAGAVPLLPHAIACQCGYGQIGDRGAVDMTAESHGEVYHRAKRDAAQLGSKWDGKTLVYAPQGSYPVCPNCGGDHDPREGK